LLSSIVTSDKEPKELRAQAANMLMPYFYNKRGTLTPPPERVYLEADLQLPHPDPRNIAQARDNIIYLSNLKSTGQIDLLWGDNLIADQYKILSALVDEAKIAIQGGEQGDQVIRIEGGLPVMPGLEQLIMPQINGHQHAELAPPQAPPTIEHEPADKDPGP
jgi:hypothetical protein